MPMPRTAQPSCGRASARMPATLRPSIRTSLGHLIARGGAERVGDRDARAQREQRVDLAQHERHRERAPRRRRPCPALAPASGDLLAGGHERAVRRAGHGELARAVVRRADRAQVQPRACRASRAAMRISSSSRSAEQLVAAPTAVDRQRERAGASS